MLTGIGLYGVVLHRAPAQARLASTWRCSTAPPVMFDSFLRHGGVAGGLAAGLPVCLALSKLASSSFYRSEPSMRPRTSQSDLPTGISMLACLGPPPRAVRMDPMRSFAEE
jgi:hypothetical protein